MHIDAAVLAAFGLSQAHSPASYSSSKHSGFDFPKRITGRTILIADQSNGYLGARKTGQTPDWDLNKLMLGGDVLVSASIVVSDPVEPRPQQDAFFAYLSRSGWQVIRHRALRNDDGSLSENEPLVDGDVRKLIRAAADSSCDSIVVLSGDGGMTNAVKYARRAGKKVFVVAWEGTMHPALAAAATATASFEELRTLISRALH